MLVCVWSLARLLVRSFVRLLFVFCVPSRTHPAVRDEESHRSTSSQKTPPDFDSILRDTHVVKPLHRPAARGSKLGHLTECRIDGPSVRQAVKTPDCDSLPHGTPSPTCPAFPRPITQTSRRFSSLDATVSSRLLGGHCSRRHKRMMFACSSRLAKNLAICAPHP